MIIMENLILVAVVVAVLVIAIGVAGVLIFSLPQQPYSGSGAAPGTSDGTTGAGSGSILGPFERNNPGVGSPPSPE